VGVDRVDKACFLQLCMRERAQGRECRECRCACGGTDRQRAHPFLNLAPPFPEPQEQFPGLDLESAQRKAQLGDDAEAEVSL
jgi:hypothetical protein